MKIYQRRYLTDRERHEALCKIVRFLEQEMTDEDLRNYFFDREYDYLLSHCSDLEIITKAERIQE